MNQSPAAKDPIRGQKHSAGSTVDRHPSSIFLPSDNEWQVIAMEKRQEISPLRVRERVTYDPATGEFVWLPKPGSGGAHAGLGLASEEVRRQRIDDTQRKLGEIFECWNDRLVLEKVSLAEAYINGRISIGVIVQISGAPFGDAASVHHDAEVMAGERPRAVLVYEVQAGADGEFEYQDQAMLVEVVQLIESPERGNSQYGTALSS
jgi:hypothetical protein